MVGGMMLLSANAEAQISVSTLSAFGGGDGWLANGESTYLANDNNARGLAYGNGHVYMATGTSIWSAAPAASSSAFSIP